MGIGTGIFAFLRPSEHGGKDRTGRPGSREKEIRFEREREREIPDFPKPPAPALRFGSMNPISRVLGHGSMGESCNGPNPAWYLGKSYNLGGVPSFLPYCRNEI